MTMTNFGAVLRGLNGFSGNEERIRRGAAGDGGMHRGAGFEEAFRIFDAQPDFDGGAAGIERGADERDLCRDRIGDAGNGDRRRCAERELLRLHLRDVQLGEQGRGVHDGDDGVPPAAVSPAKRGRSVTTPLMGLRISV